MSVPIPNLLGIIKACKQISLEDLGILLDIDPDNLGNTLTPYLEEKNVLKDGNEVKFLSLSDSQPEIQLSDAIVLGFLKLHRISNLDDISAEFLVESSIVLTSVAILNQWQEVNIVLHHEKTPDGMIVYLELIESCLELDLITRNSAKFSNLIDIIDKNYANQEFGIHTFHLLIGHMKFLRDFNWKSAQFSYIIECSHPLLSKIYEIKHIVEILCLFALDPSLDLKMVESKYIEFQVRFSPREGRGILSHFDSSIVNSILSVLGSVRMITIREIQKRFSGSEEILPLLLSLSYFGFVKGVLAEDGTLSIQSVTNFDEQLDLLSSNEKIVLGYLKTAKKPNLNELGRTLQMNKTDVRFLLDRFTFFKKYNGQIARNDDILLPQSIDIPLTTKIEKLAISKQTVLGALLWHPRIKLPAISHQLKFTEQDVLRILYELVGNGLVEVQLEKMLIEVTNVSDFKATSDDFLFEEIFSLIDQNTLKINLEILKQNLELADDEFNSLKYRFLANYYPMIAQTSDQYIVMVEIPAKFRTFECMYCSNSINRNELSCQSCSKEIEYCTVCRGIIVSSDKLSSCPSCHRFSHQNHILQWLEIRNICPACKNILGANQLVEVKI